MIPHKFLLIRLLVVVCITVTIFVWSARQPDMQRVQNTAARLICETNQLDHIISVPYKLHWLPAKCRIDFKILLIAYKVINGFTPEYISELIKLKASTRHNFRSSTELLRDMLIEKL